VKTDAMMRSAVAPPVNSFSATKINLIDFLQINQQAHIFLDFKKPNVHDADVPSLHFHP